MSAAAFYCVTGCDFFPGAVALLNSLRLLGHDEPLHVLDCGMRSDQRRRIASHATVVDAPRRVAPSLLKLVAPQAHPADVVVLLDADLIVTRPLGELIERAAQGAVVAFENDSDRHFPEWAELLDVGPVRRGPYLTSSAVFCGGGPASELLPMLAERQAAIDPARTWLGGGEVEDPLYYLDQDVLNAIVHSNLNAEQVVPIASSLAPIPPFAGVKIADASTLRCVNRDGGEPYFLHHCFRKPWLERIRSNAYSRLLTRLLFSPDVALRLESEELPGRLRPGAVGATRRLATDALMSAPGVLRRLRRRPAKVTAWPRNGQR